MPRPAIPPTRPVFGHLEAEWLMKIILASGHKEAGYLVDKLIRGAETPEVYEKLRERVQRAIDYT